MKFCAACHTDLPKDSYSKKQWKLDQRRCKVCINNNREVLPPKQDNNNDPNTNEIVETLDSMRLEDVERRISDEELFKQPPPAEDCPICFIRLPTLWTGSRYKTCCGKRICSGCSYAPVYDSQGNEVDNQKCAFCRTTYPKTIEEAIERLRKRAEAEDPLAIHNQGNYYRDGRNGFPQDLVKALELWHRAAELGNARAYDSIGIAYQRGNLVKVDEKKAIYYYEQAAIGGEVAARFNLGINEEIAGNMDRALKHYMIAVKGGHSKSLDKVKVFYSKGIATKDDYTTALRLYQEYLGEIKSPQRDKVAAFRDEFRYY